MDTLEEFAESLDRHVAPATYPVAVKLLGSEDEIPAKAKRPKRDFGQSIMPCEGSALARRQGLTVAMLSEDFDPECPLGLIVFGIVKPPLWWLAGNFAYKLLTETREGANDFYNSLFRLEYGKYIGVLFSPVRTASLDPDVVVVYCSPAQAASLIGAARHGDGAPLTPKITSTAVCSMSIVQTVQTGRCQLSIPCGGDRAYAFAKDDEVVFSAPFNRLGSITRGLEALAKVFAPTDPILRKRAGTKSQYRKRTERLMHMIERQLRQNSKNINL